MQIVTVVILAIAAGPTARSGRLTHIGGDPVHSQWNSHHRSSHAAPAAPLEYEPAGLSDSSIRPATRGGVFPQTGGTNVHSRFVGLETTDEYNTDSRQIVIPVPESSDAMTQDRRSDSQMAPAAEMHWDGTNRRMRGEASPRMATAVKESRTDPPSDERVLSTTAVTTAVTTPDATARQERRHEASEDRSLKESSLSASRIDRRFPLILTLLFSISLNAFLVWITWDTHIRYQDLITELEQSGRRRLDRDLTTTANAA